MAMRQTAVAPPAKDLNISLSGLDRAEELEQRSQLEESFQLYESSIGTMLKVLRENSSLPGNVDRDVLAERVGVALSAAESIKVKIREREGRLVAEKKPKAVTIEEWGESSFQSTASSRGPLSIISAVTAALSRSGSSRSIEGMVVEDSRKKPQGSAKTLPPPKSLAYAAATVSSSNRAHARSYSGSLMGNLGRGGSGKTAAGSDPTVTSSTQVHFRRRQQQPNKPPKQQAQQRHRAKRSNLDYANDSIVQTIKSDLYVDGSSISTTWDDVSGLGDAKRALQEAAILPLLRPDLYTGLRKAPRGILLYGPPGTGKTMLVRAVAHESQCILFACTASALTSKWHGEGEKIIRTLFRMAADVAPAILFFDEIDALLSKRKGDEHEASRRFKTEFMVQMDGIVAVGGSGSCESFDRDNEEIHRILIVGCTHFSWDIDDAIMRKFQKRINIPLPYDCS